MYSCIYAVELMHVSCRGSRSFGQSCLSPGRGIVGCRGSKCNRFQQLNSCESRLNKVCLAWNDSESVTRRAVACLGKRGFASAGKCGLWSVSHRHPALQMCFTALFTAEFALRLYACESIAEHASKLDPDSLIVVTAVKDLTSRLQNRAR